MFYTGFTVFNIVSGLSLESLTSGLSSSSQGTLQLNVDRDRLDYNGLDFHILIDSKSGPQIVIVLVASTHIEKAAWCSDISQVIQYSDALAFVTRRLIG